MMSLFYTVKILTVLITKTSKFHLKSENNWKIINQKISSNAFFCFTDENREVAVVMEGEYHILCGYENVSIHVGCLTIQT